MASIKSTLKNHLINDFGVQNDSGTLKFPVNTTVEGQISDLESDVAALQGQNFFTEVRAAGTAALATYTYDNGTAGVGATITADANGALAAVDGVTLIANDRVLVMDAMSSDNAHNGIYTVTTVGDGSNAFVLTRATDGDESAEMVQNKTVAIGEGTTNAGKTFAITSASAPTVGTTAITWGDKGGSSLGDGSVTTAKLAADAVDGDKIADDAVDSEHIADGAIDNAHMAADSVDSDQLVDGSVDNVHLASGIDASKITTGTLPAAQLPTSAMSYEGSYDASTNSPDLTGTSFVEGATYIVSAAGTQDLGGSIASTAFAIGDMLLWNGSTFDHIPKDTTLSDAEVKTAYENNSDTNAFTDAEQTKLGNIEDNATADQTGAEIKTAYESEADTNAYNDADKAKMDYISVTQAVDLDIMEFDIASKQNALTHGDGVTVASDVVSVDLYEVGSSVGILKAYPENDADYVAKGSDHFSDLSYDWLEFPVTGFIYTDGFDLRLSLQTISGTAASGTAGSGTNEYAMWYREDPNNAGTYQMMARKDVENTGTVYGYYAFTGLASNPSSISTQGALIQSGNYNEYGVISQTHILYSGVLHGFDIDSTEAVAKDNTYATSRDFFYRSRFDFGSLAAIESVTTSDFNVVDGVQGYITDSNTSDIELHTALDYAVFAKDNGDSTWTLMARKGIAGNWYSYKGITTDPSTFAGTNGEILHTYTDATERTNSFELFSSDTQTIDNVSYPNDLFDQDLVSNVTNASYLEFSNSKIRVATSLIDRVTANDAKITYPAADSTKVGYISVTQAVDLDAIETSVESIANKVDNYISAYNDTGSALAVDKLVYISGEEGGSGNPTVALADNTSASTMSAVGFITTEIADATSGTVITHGIITSLATDTATAGDAVYVGTSGNFTFTKPTGTALIQKIGVVIRSHASNGSILIVGAGRTNDLPALADGYVWRGNASGVPTAVAMDVYTAPTLPGITSSATGSGTNGVEVSYQATSAADVIWSMTDTDTTGYSIDRINGTLQGTNPSAGTYDIEIYAMDLKTGGISNQTVTFTIS